MTTPLIPTLNLYDVTSSKNVNSNLDFDLKNTELSSVLFRSAFSLFSSLSLFFEVGKRRERGTERRRERGREGARGRERGRGIITVLLYLHSYFPRVI